MSLFEWDIVITAGVRRAGQLRVHDPGSGFRTALPQHACTFALLVVGLNLVVALSLAVALQRTLPTILRYYYRTAFFLPMVISMASIAIVLGFLFHKELGIINYYLGLLGDPPVPWLTSSILGAMHDRAGDGVEELRLRPDPVHRRHPEHPPPPLRGGRDRRRERLAPVLADHAAAAFARRSSSRSSSG